MKRLLTCVLVAMQMCLAQLWAQQIMAHRGEIKDGYNFWFFDPGDRLSAGALAVDSAAVIHYDSVGNVLKPLIVYLHGRDHCGVDMYKVLRMGSPLDALQRGLRVDAYIVAPQNPGTAWNPDKVWQTVEWAKANYPIDTCRIYAIGMSLGGYGVLDFASVYYERLAAALGMCGGCTAKDVSGLNSMPLWIAHGLADTKVPFSCSQAVVNKMKAQGATDRLIFTRIVGGSHGLLAKVFYWKPAYQWLFSHSLDDDGRPVCRKNTGGMTVKGLENVYRDLGPWRKTVTVPIIDGGRSIDFIDDGKQTTRDRATRYNPKK